MTSFKSELDAFAVPPKFLAFDWTLENYEIVQERSDYLRHAINSIILAGGSTLVAPGVRHPGRLGDGLLADKADPRTAAVDAVHQDDAAGRRADPDLPASSAMRACSTRRLGLVVLLCLANLPIVIWMLFTYFKEIPKRHPRGGAHGRRHHRGGDRLSCWRRWRCPASPRPCCSTSSWPGTRRSGR